MGEPLLLKPWPKLPFRVYSSKGPLFSNGESVTVRVNFGSTATAPMVEDADSLFTGFLHLALSGALSGKNIPPNEATISDCYLAGVKGSSATWELTNCRVDELSRFIIVLILRETHKKYPITSVQLHSVDKLAESYLGEIPLDPYPMVSDIVFARLPVSISYSKSLLVEVFLGSTPIEKVITSSRIRIENWIAATAMGFYSNSDENVHNNAVQYDRSDLVFRDNIIELNLQRLLAHVGATRGLINAIAAEFQDSIQAIEVS